METKFNFKSSVCTSLEQSERLLALGLKKETADMGYVEVFCTDDTVILRAETLSEGYTIRDDDCIIPAWSLHRLIELIWGDGEYDTGLESHRPFEDCIERIDYMINQSHCFNKEYLV